MVRRRSGGRNSLFLVLGAVVLIAGAAQAQTFPSKPIEFVVLTVATGAVLTQASRPDMELPLNIYTPLALFAQDPQVVAVRAESKFKTFKELAVTGERRFARAPDIPTLKELGYNIVAATGRGFAMPAGVPKGAAAAMEAALKRVHDSPAYKDYSERNMFEDMYLDSAGFAQYLVTRRIDQEAFLKALGLLK